MNFFKRISNYLAQIFQNSNAKALPVSEKNFLVKQQASLKKMKENLTELVFQRKKLESQIYNLSNESLHIKEDLETAAFQDKDEVAIFLMERQEEVHKELALLQSHLKKVQQEIAKTKELEGSFSGRIEKAKVQFAILRSRKEATGLRQRLQEDLTSASASPFEESGFQRIEEEILRLEAVIETLDSDESNLQSEVRAMRRSKTDRLKVNRLNELKTRLRRRQLPEAVELKTKNILQPIAEVH